MEKNEIKKLLYKTNPTAKLINKTDDMYSYEANSDAGILKFEVPVSDMGDADFLSEMDSKLLIRWLQ